MTTRSPKKILIVEDELALRQVLNEKFKREGFTVLEASDGEAGLRQAIEGRPDVILLDMLMPKMDGLGVLKKLRDENDYGKKVPVLLLTNVSPDNDDMINAIEAMPKTYYILKASYSLQAIVNKVKEVMA